MSIRLWASSLDSIGSLSSSLKIEGGGRGGIESVRDERLDGFVVHEDGKAKYCN